MANETFEDVCANIRACLNSSKDQISITALNHDYNGIIGWNIPFRKLGFNTLEDLVRAVPKLKFNRIGNELYIDVKPDKKTAHITTLVREQKSGKRKPKERYNKPLPSRRNYNLQSGKNRGGFNNNKYSNTKKQQSDYAKDLKNEPNYIYHKYRSTRPSQYDFSDKEEQDNFEDYDAHEFDDVKVSANSVNKPKKEVDNFKNLHITVDNTRVGTGKSNMKLRGGLRMSNRSNSCRTNSLEDDTGYSSMNKRCNGYATLANGVGMMSKKNYQEINDWDDSISEVTVSKNVIGRTNDWDDSISEVTVSKNVIGRTNDWDDSISKVTVSKNVIGRTNDWDDTVIETNSWDNTVPSNYYNKSDRVEPKKSVYKEKKNGHKYYGSSVENNTVIDLTKSSDEFEHCQGKYYNKSNQFEPKHSFYKENKNVHKYYGSSVENDTVVDLTKSGNQFKQKNLMNHIPSKTMKPVRLSVTYTLGGERLVQVGRKSLACHITNLLEGEDMSPVQITIKNDSSSNRVVRLKNYTK